MSAGEGRHARDVALNAVGWVLPAALALVAIPALTRTLGAERFGLLALAWAVVGVFAVLDLGLGRALALLVAERRAAAAAAAPGASSVASLARAAGALAWLVFAPLALAGVLLAPWIARAALDVPPSLELEAVRTLRVLAVSLPIVVHGILLRAVFEGEQRFVLVNALRIPLGVVTWGGPWLAVAFTADVSVLAAVIVLGRTLYWLAQLWVLGARADAGARGLLDAGIAPAARELLSRGGWITLSGIISPILTGLDRLVVGLVAPIAAVGWYVAAGEAATKLWLFPAALGPVLASALATAQARGDRRLVRQLLQRAELATIGLLVVPVTVAVAFAEPILRWWLSAAFAPQAVPTFQLFVVAVFVNSVAQVAYTGLQALGQARQAAVLHLIELPLFVLALIILGRSYGAAGLAWAWAGRLVVDGVIMIGLGRRNG